MKLATKQAIIRDFDKAAKNYDEHALVQRKAADHLFSLVKKQLSDESFVLDAGCGTGYFHELLRKNKIYCPLIQSDISHAMCRKAYKYASPKEYGGTYTCNADMELLPIANNSIDMVFSSLTLQWLHDIESSIMELRRTLKKGGIIAINTIGAGTLRELNDSFSQMDSLQHINDNFITKEYLLKIFEQSGFKNIQISENTINMQHKNLRSLLQSIKGIGAGYKSTSSRKYLGRNYFVKLEEIYKTKFEQGGLLSASWNIIYAVAEK